MGRLHMPAPTNLPGPCCYSHQSALHWRPRSPSPVQAMPVECMSHVKLPRPGCYSHPTDPTGIQHLLRLHTATHVCLLCCHLHMTPSMWLLQSVRHLEGSDANGRQVARYSCTLVSLASAAHTQTDESTVVRVATWP